MKQASTRHRIVRWAFFLGLVAYGCGETSKKDGSEGEDDHELDHDAAKGGTEAKPTDEGAPSTPPMGAIFGEGASAPAGGGGTTGADARCASTQVESAQLPVSLLLLVDRSSSMGMFGRWGPCVAGIKAFLADPRSKGLRASVSFFPSGGLDICSEGAYRAPAAPLHDLPDPSGLSGVLDAAIPLGLGSPALPAFRGAAEYIRGLQAQGGPPAKYVLALVSDGEPNACDSSIQNITQFVASLRATVPTYVIGLGNEGALDAIAQAGGTGKAIVVSADGAATASQLQGALASIRHAQMACDYAVPAPPPGKTLELAKVNVTVATAQGAAPLAYSKDCSAAGWHYDNPDKPTRIMLCPSACEAVKRETAAKVSVDVGCVTRGTSGMIPR